VAAAAATSGSGCVAQEAQAGEDDAAADYDAAGDCGSIHLPGA